MCLAAGAQEAVGFAKIITWAPSCLTLVSDSRKPRIPFPASYRVTDQIMHSKEMHKCELGLAQSSQVCLGAEGRHFAVF